MSKTKARLEQLRKLRSDKLEGKINGIPLWDYFPRFASAVPSIQKGHMIMVTTFSGVGKTQFTKSFGILSPWLSCRNHPEYNTNLKFVVFLLEESEEEFIDSIIVSLLFLKFQITVDPLTLRSEFKEEINDEILDKVEEIQDDIDDLLDRMDIVTSIYNTTGMYKFCREKSEEWGVHYYTPLLDPGIKHITRSEYDMLPYIPENLKKKSKAELISIEINPLSYKDFWKYSHYTPTDPNEQVIMVLDNLNLIEPDRNEKDLKDAIPNWTAKYCRKNMSKHWGWTCINVQQQEQGSEKQQFTFGGQSIVDKLKPSLGGLGDAKRSQRDMTLILGLFAPDRHKIEDYEGYNITTLKDKFRSAVVLKNRHGRSNLELPLFFKGECNYFQELPTTMTPQDYTTFLNL